MIKIQVILSTTRQERRSEQIGKWVIAELKKNEDIEAELVDLKDWQLPFYNEVAGLLTLKREQLSSDLAKKWQEKIDVADGYIIVTAEYNHGYPAVLKNALDHGSRPFGSNSWGNKPAAIIGISPSPIGTALAQQHLRGILATLNMPTLCQPEMFLQIKDSFFDEAGNIGEGSKQFLLHWIEIMIKWIRSHSSH